MPGQVVVVDVRGEVGVAFDEQQRSIQLQHSDGPHQRHEIGQRLLARLRALVQPGAQGGEVAFAVAEPRGEVGVAGMPIQQPAAGWPGRGG
jgi:hypothetical protein